MPNAARICCRFCDQLRAADRNARATASLPIWRRPSTEDSTFPFDADATMRNFQDSRLNLSPNLNMCCFSQPVTSVNSTNIFAREGDDGRQFLVYSMFLNAKSDLAMILPLPVKTPAAERDVQFVDLKAYPNFFGDLETGFPS